MNILILDNYDSFTYNLVQYTEELLGRGVTVCRNNEITLSEVNKFDGIILSPGPGLPRNAGIMPELILEFATTKNILGICLGHQAIGEAFGGRLKNLNSVYHGIKTPVTITHEEELFHRVPRRIEVGRYHSWVIDRNNFPSDLQITALDDDDEIQAIAHKTHQIRGVQFHPESIMTHYGRQMLDNFLRIVKKSLSSNGLKNGLKETVNSLTE